MTVGVAILGSGNIGTDLMMKLHDNPHLHLRLVAGIEPQSKGLALARERGVPASAEGIKAVLADPHIKIVFDATSAKAHLEHAPLLREAGKTTIDLTPASIGPAVIPVVNLPADGPGQNVSLATCGAQATVPVVHAVSRVVSVAYAEIVSTIASRSAGPGTRQNIDEFTVATARALERVGGAQTGKAIIILNPAEPPILMTNTIYCLLQPGDANGQRTGQLEERVDQSVQRIVSELQQYVPGYRLKAPPFVEAAPDGVGFVATIMVEVEGAGDFLPTYAGNLDIMTAAAVRVAEQAAATRQRSVG